MRTPKIRNPLVLAIAIVAALVAPSAAGAAMTPTPTSFDWGDVDRYQQSYQQTFTFANNTGVAVSPQAGLSGPNANQFVIVSDGCSGGFVPDGSNCNVDLRVSPQTAGALAASLDVDDGNGVAAVQLAATAVTGTLSIDPDPIGFGPQPWFFGGQNINVNVQAIDRGVQISDVELSGPDQSLFSFNYGNCAGNTLQAFNGCSVGVGFNPTGPSGQASANLVVTSDGNGSPQTIPITAEALSGPLSQISPASKDFGAVELGTASAAQTFTLTNVGDSPDQIQQIFAVSGTPQSFPISEDGCTLQVVAPGNSCEFDVSFAPSNTGMKEASIFAISSGPSPVTQVGLSGEGFDPPGAAAVIKGEPAVGETLSCEPLNVNGELTYAWLRDGAEIGGADRSTYLLTDADYGSRVGCRITATNPLGSTSAESTQVGPIAARDLAGDSHSLVNQSSCRVVVVEAVAGVEVSGTDPATPDSPLTFEGKKSLSVDFGGLERSGKRIRFTPRRLSGFADGAVPLTINGATGEAVLAPCALSGVVSGGRGSRNTYALSARNGIRSGEIRTRKLTIRPQGRDTGRATVYSHGRPAVSFPISGKRTTYNGVRVKLARHAVKLSNLFDETSTVEIHLAPHVVRGRGGVAKAKALLQGRRNEVARFKTSWP